MSSRRITLSKKSRPSSLGYHHIIPRNAQYCHLKDSLVSISQLIFHGLAMGLWCWREWFDDEELFGYESWKDVFEEMNIGAFVYNPRKEARRRAKRERRAVRLAELAAAEAEAAEEERNEGALADQLDNVFDSLLYG